MTEFIINNRTDAWKVTGNTLLVKFLGKHIRDSSGVFSISSLVKISMISLISSLSLKIVLKFVRESSKYLRVFLESHRQSSEMLATFAWPSDKFWRIFENLRKVVGNLPRYYYREIMFLPLEHEIHIMSPKCYPEYQAFLSKWVGVGRNYFLLLPREEEKPDTQAAEV